MSFSDVHPGDPMNAANVQQVIDALKGTAGKGIPLVVDAVNDSTRYALTLQNDDTTNSRAINVLKSDGTVMIAADATGVTLGSPLNVQNNSVPGTAITNASITNAKLGPDVARANLLTNPGFEVWQRGNGPFSSNGAFTADMWTLGLSGSGPTISGSRDTTNVDTGSGACMAVTTAGTGYPTVFVALAQNAMDNSAAGVRNRTLSFSVRVKTTLANTVRLQIWDGVSGAFSAYHTGSGQYETLSVTYAMSASATQTRVQVLISAAGTVYLDNAMLVVGATPADYVPLHPADDLARCLRYYELLTVPASNEWIGLVQCYSATGANTAVRYKTQKVVTPTVTIVNPTGFSLQPAGGGAVATTNVTVGSASVNTAGINLAVASGLVAGNASLWSVAPGLGQIIAESNP